MRTRRRCVCTRCVLQAPYASGVMVVVLECAGQLLVLSGVCGTAAGMDKLNDVMESGRVHSKEAYGEPAGGVYSA